MNETLKISINNIVFDLPIEFYREKGDFIIIFYWRKKKVKIKSWSYFNAFLKFRKSIRRNYFLCDGARMAKFLCNGSRIDFWPSGSNVDMNGGLSGYVHEISKPCALPIGTFDFYDGKMLATPFEQESYQDNWSKIVRSLIMKDKILK